MTRLKCASTVILIVCLLIPMSVHSETKEYSVAIINIGNILTESVAVKNIDSQVDEIKRKDLVEVTKIDKKLRAEQAELISQKSILLNEEYLKRTNKLKKKANTLRDKYKNKAARLQQAKMKALRFVRDAIAPIVSDVANKRQIHVILANTEVIFAKKELNITDEVMNTLNNTLKTVKIDFKNPVKQ